MPEIKDFSDLIKLLNKHKAKYCIVGAFAVAYHAQPRYTKDLDILVEPTLNNGQNIVKALVDFGFGSLKLKAKDFIPLKQVIQLGYEPIRIDLLTSIDGLTFAEVWKNKVVDKFGRYKTYYIGLKQLIKNKKSSNRPQDWVDLQLLMRI